MNYMKFYASSLIVIMSAYSALADTQNPNPSPSLGYTYNTCRSDCYDWGANQLAQCISQIGGVDTPDRECAEESNNFINMCSNNCQSLFGIYDPQDEPEQPQSPVKPYKPAQSVPPGGIIYPYADPEVQGPYYVF